jgi:Mrp family chromosome partitioning ATPase
LVVGITSAVDGEGKTTIARELALGLTRSATWDNPVLQVECGEPPAVPVRDRHGRRVGWQQVFAAAGLHYRTLQSLRAEGIELRRATLSEAFEGLRHRYRFTVLDLPSVLNDPLGADLAGEADGVYLVVRAGGTPAHLVLQALDRLDQVRLEGVILNDMRRSTPRWLSWLVSA